MEGSKHTEIGFLKNKSQTMMTFASKGQLKTDYLKNEVGKKKLSHKIDLCTNIKNRNKNILHMEAIFVWAVIIINIDFILCVFQAKECWMRL